MAKLQAQRSAEQELLQKRNFGEARVNEFWQVESMNFGKLTSACQVKSSQVKSMNRRAQDSLKVL